MPEMLRSGDWLTGERLRIYPRLLLFAFAVAIACGVVASRDRMGPNDLPLGSDFGQVWVAGREARAGAPEAPYDFSRHIAAQQAEFPKMTGVFGWHYPPYFLIPAALLASFPYLAALAIWQLTTLSAYLAVVAAILSDGGLRWREAVVATLAFPAVFVNLGHGQNGFLTAALLGGGLWLIDRRPILAGTLLALLAYKPHFVVILPLALIIERRWRALAAAGATFLGMTLATLIAFGPGTWRAFFDSVAFTRRMAEQGATGFEKIQSVYAGVRLLGGGGETAWFVQALVAGAALAALLCVLRSTADARLKSAASIVILFLTTPYVLDYDMAALAPALALVLTHGLRQGFAPFEKTLLAAAYAAPFLSRPIAQTLGMPIGVIVVTLLFISIACRATVPERMNFHRLRAAAAAFDSNLRSMFRTGLSKS